MDLTKSIEAAKNVPSALLAHWDAAIVVALIDEGYNMLERAMPGELVGMGLTGMVIKGFRAVSEHYVLMNSLTK